MRQSDQGGAPMPGTSLQTYESASVPNIGNTIMTQENLTISNEDERE
eukprot:CAMPEP_0185599408 /NCGR_PEP_ID=MMETSP0434-20130131/82683_1 /TAXON_ID=626734 ORGANISM="Favella taraikaensis, Strain Fe Narragansett Bay" /NCGR_SAMPLE_ID=MMETSP0434 /ASSEMBLY_ACC=CAM_ASM_000379 /LENGTH=46 /DNA_ID= /DNA_START= /DNA_END= /DNA_ORIENTATION=